MGRLRRDIRYFGSIFVATLFITYVLLFGIEKVSEKTSQLLSCNKYTQPHQVNSLVIARRDLENKRLAAKAFFERNLENIAQIGPRETNMVENDRQHKAFKSKTDKTKGQHRPTSVHSLNQQTEQIQKRIFLEKDARKTHKNDNYEREIIRQIEQNWHLKDHKKERNTIYEQPHRLSNSENHPIQDNEMPRKNSSKNNAPQPEQRHHDVKNKTPRPHQTKRPYVINREKHGPEQEQRPYAIRKDNHRPEQEQRPYAIRKDNHGPEQEQRPYAIRKDNHRPEQEQRPYAMRKDNHRPEQEQRPYAIRKDNHAVNEDPKNPRGQHAQALYTNIYQQRANQMPVTSSETPGSQYVRQAEAFKNDDYENQQSGQRQSLRSDIRANQQQQIEPLRNDIREDHQQQIEPLRSDIRANQQQQIEPLRNDIREDHQQQIEPLRSDIRANQLQQIEPLRNDIRANQQQQIEPLRSDIRANQQQQIEPLRSDIRENQHGQQIEPLRSDIRENQHGQKIEPLRSDIHEDQQQQIKPIRNDNREDEQGQKTQPLKSEIRANQKQIEPPRSDIRANQLQQFEPLRSDIRANQQQIEPLRSDIRENQQQQIQPIRNDNREDEQGQKTQPLKSEIRANQQQQMKPLKRDSRDQQQDQNTEATGDKMDRFHLKQPPKNVTVIKTETESGQETSQDTSGRAKECTSGSPQYVILLTYGRSGSSLTSDIISEHPHVFSYFEPLHDLAQSFYPTQVDYWNKNHRYLHLTAIRQYNEAAIKMLEKQMTCDYSELDRYATLNKHAVGMKSTRELFLCVERSLNQSDVEECLMEGQKRCEGKSLRFIKTIRLSVTSAATLLARHPCSKLVYLIRDPRGSYYSKTRMFDSHGHDVNFEAQRFCPRLDKDVDAIRILKERYPDRVMMTRFETIAAQPIASTKNIYDFIGLEFTQKIAAFVYWKTHSARGGRGYSTNRANALEACYRWRHFLLYQHAIAFGKFCSTSFAKLGYLPVNSIGELRDLNRTLLSSGEMFS